MPKRRRKKSGPPPRQRPSAFQDYEYREAQESYSESTIDEVLSYDVKTRQVTYRDPLSFERTVDPLLYFHESHALVLILSYIEVSPEDPKSDNNPHLTSWVEQLKERRDLCLLQEGEDLQPQESVEESPQFLEANTTNPFAISTTIDEMAFCCAICKCDRKSRNVWKTGANTLYHRHCCHNIENPKKPWRSPVDKLEEEKSTVLTSKLKKYDDLGNEIFSHRDLQRKLKELAQEDDEVGKLERISKSELNRIFITAKHDEVAYVNADFDVSPVDVVKTDENYDKYQKHYNELVKVRASSPQGDDAPQPAVVLDLFAGIGSGIVALKRLQIAMKKVIHVEYDKVANHVNRYNHDVSYNADLEDDGIEHICDYSMFEDIEKRLDEIMAKHGPIDIILGGPPCIDFASINAYRKGVDGVQGQYLKRLGELIRKIRYHKGQKGHPLFFLAENVVLKGNDLDAVSKAFEISPLEVDAHYFSPCRRKRYFFLNYPVDFDVTGAASASEVVSCLQDGWAHPADAVGDPDKKLEPKLRKANTFMASKGRVDDDRMTVVKKTDEGNFIGRSLMTVERELMMGFPEGYAGNSLNPLFEGVKDAMCNKLLPHIQKPWTKTIDKNILCFAGDLPNLALDYRTLEACVRLAPPKTGKQRVYYSRDEYGKRLLGNAYSVVVVELLLHPLAKLYPRRRYRKFEYKFAWPHEYLDLSENACES